MSGDRERDFDDLLDGSIEREIGEAAREVEREVRQAEREARRAEREAEREGRRAEREREREERHRLRVGVLGRTVTIEPDEHGPEQSATVERRFSVSGMPRLRVRNVSGYTRIGVGTSGEVLVRAHKRVLGWSPDRAKRLLENVEIRMDQDGDEIVVEPQLHEQERGWLDLFRGGRVVVDLEVTLPRESQIDASTVSGPLRVRGIRGQLEARTVSAEIELDDVQGPVRLRTVSGDAEVRDFAGKVEANSTSGDLRFERSRVKRPDIVTVSGDIRIDGALITSAESDGRIKTVSGDVDLRLAEPALELDYQTLSGDMDVDLRGAQIQKRGRREWTIVLGAGGGRVKVKTVSGDLTVRGTAAERPIETEPVAEEVVASEPEVTAKSDVIGLLERVARGELSVDDAANALDAQR